MRCHNVIYNFDMTLAIHAIENAPRKKTDNLKNEPNALRRKGNTQVALQSIMYTIEHCYFEQLLLAERFLYYYKFTSWKMYNNR